ncbi:MAG: DUF1697 domain-containing protein [Pseudomonadota bacterium]
MLAYIALLRAVNVGGTGKLPMAELVEVGKSIGLTDPRTYIQSGNLLFRSDEAEDVLRSRIEGALKDQTGLNTSVFIRTTDEMRAVVEANPFPQAAPNQLMVLFLAEAISGDPLDGAKGHKDEQIQAIGREIYIHFPSGAGKSRLKLAAMDGVQGGTMRNLNTVRKLVELHGEA